MLGNKFDLKWIYKSKLRMAQAKKDLVRKITRLKIATKLELILFTWL